MTLSSTFHEQTGSRKPAPFQILDDETQKLASAQSDNEKTKEVQPELLRGFRQAPKQVPCSYLYDEKGSALYNKITELEEYYPFRTELSMLQDHSEDIISHIPEGSVLVELGCGSAQKTALLLDALLLRDGPDACTFVGIDVSHDFLEQAKDNLLTACPKMRPEGVELVQAEYMNGVREARRRHPEATLCILWLGSSVGNLDPTETLQFFKDLLCIGGPKTEVLVCTDLWKDSKTLHAAYCDSQGVTEAFILNGMRNAIAVASSEKVEMNEELWQYDVVVNNEKHQVEMYVIAGENLDLGQGIQFKKGERILIEVSRKFETQQLRGLAYHSGFYFQAQWANPKYSIQLFCTPQQACLLAWRDTDNLFSYFNNWEDVPIELRHPFLFYYGHVASFAKLRLAKGKEASDWDTMFSRGIDPDVSDPSQCHDHPELPPQWPPKKDVIAYTLKQREIITESLNNGTFSAWMVWMVLEHERLHQETLCYMLAQQQKRDWQSAHLTSDGGVLENGVAFKESLARWDKRSLGLLHDRAAAGGDYVDIANGKVDLGVATDGSCGFVWDNEGPSKTAAAVKAFKVGSSPVLVADFREFVITAKGYSNPKYWDPSHHPQAEKQLCPSTWTVTDEGDVWVHYPEGTWNWEQVKHRPVWCSLAEAKAYARFKQARIMTEAEYVRALDFDPTESRCHMLTSGGWEWTCTEFAPLAGFQPVEEYKEYSQDFFDGKHFVLRGSSPYTHPSAVRRSFRNFYQETYPHMFAKFRLCS